MSHISVTVRLRPVRLAFLVNPDDGASVLEIFRVNTCLWGGKYNPIIPCFSQAPSWWDRHVELPETPERVLNGYLDFFEPDFIVESETGLGSASNFDKDRIFQLPDFLARQQERASGLPGLNILGLYRDLYQREFQFTRRHEHNIIDVASEDPRFTLFSACVFGAFPTQANLSYLGTAFVDAFAPKKISLNAVSLASLYKSSFTSALSIGHSQITVDYYDSRGQALFVLDADEPRDLIDYWNLRAFRRNVVPLPVQWAADLSEFAKRLITEAYRPLPGNQHGVMLHATVMFSRSLPTSDLDTLYTKHFRVNVAEANLRQDWYPSFWQPSSEIVARETRPTLSAEQRTDDAPLSTDDAAVRFNCLQPTFAPQYANENRWANVVRLRDWTFRDQVATVFPCDHRKALTIRVRIGAGPLLATTEGLVIFPRYTNASELWNLPDGTTAIIEWLQTYGLKATLSDAGRSTQQIIHTLGGFTGVTGFAHRDIVMLLNEISRRPVSRSIHHQEFKNRVRDATKGDAWKGQSFDNLIQRGALELGLELKCTKCASWSWYPLKQLDYQMSCSLCLRQFGFPITEPSAHTNARWAYRLVGPFALPDYARGGYAASLSIRFFAKALQHLDTGVTWSAGQTLELASKSISEVDFILWYQRKLLFGNDYPTEIIFGEAKSFGKEAFSADDIERMRTLALRIPNSILVFSTMKSVDELSKDEVERITELAEWGREYMPERQQTRAPVIVLTGTELFASFSLSATWQAKGGKHAELIKPGWVNVDNVRVLADLTQQLYLNMPSYGTWLLEKYHKRRQEKSGKPSGDAATRGDQASV